MRGSLTKNICRVFMAALLFMMVPVGASAEEETHIVILATSDMHGNILGYSYEDNKETDNNGMARLYTYIKQVREENPTVFLVDGGDAIQGTIMTDDIANKEPDSEHPVIAAMNFMGYDAMTLGNHEFDWGVETMKKITGQAAFPVLGANILEQDGNYVTGEGWTIVERGGVRLAIIGVCIPDIPKWDGEKEGISDLIYGSPAAAVRKAVEEIGDQADVILVSAHMGLAQYDEEGEDGFGEEILHENPEVDILQVAHLHITVNEKFRETPVVGVRNSGREIGRIDVTLGPDRKIRNIQTEIVEMDDYEPAGELMELPVVKELHERTVSLVQDGSGEDEPVHPLGSTTAGFQPENEIAGLPEGKLRDTAVMDLILKVELLNSGADVAASALFKDTSDLPEGDICYGDIFNIYKYDNTLYTMDVTGRELKDYMEWTAECYNQWKPGDINISFDPDIPGFLYDMFEGIEYEINLSKPKGERIENVMFKGEPLEDDQILKLAVNNYRYTSAIKALDLAEGKRDWESSNSIRDMIVEYFAENSPVEPSVDNNWRITGIDLSEDDPRRAVIIGYINERLLPTPYDKSYNLSEYDALVAEAEANRAAGIIVEERATR